MTYTRAKLIIWNHETYSVAEVREAAIFILATLNARPEDIDQATSVI
jgi:hypothetical protein